jgi:hypothetical protein
MVCQGQADMDQLDGMKELRSMDDALDGRRQSDQRMTARFKKRQTKGISAQVPNPQPAWIKLKVGGERDASDDFGKPDKF